MRAPRLHSRGAAPAQGSALRRAYLAAEKSWCHHTPWESRDQGADGPEAAAEGRAEREDAAPRAAGAREQRAAEQAGPLRRVLSSRGDTRNLDAFPPTAQGYISKARWAARQAVGLRVRDRVHLQP